MKILIIEDNTEIIDIVAVTLQLRWPEIELISCSLGKRGVELVEKEKPDVVLLDLGLPDIDGFQVLRSIREFSNIPVVILSVRGEEMHKIRGLELGADDYIVKPFSPGELLARLKAVIRRYELTEHIAKPGNIGNIGKTVIRAPVPTIRGNFRIDFASQQVSIGDKLLRLGPREYELLHILVAADGKVVPDKALLEKVFPEDKEDPRFLELYMKKLVEELELDAEKPEIIAREGEGFKFIG